MVTTNDMQVSWSKGEELEVVKKFGEDVERQKYLIVWV
jgi:hypothetical protein